MGRIDYNDISKVYDQVRQGEKDIIEKFMNEMEFSQSTVVLDIGCGTGNYTDIVKRVTRADVYGMDPSEGMLAKARRKNGDIKYSIGNAMDIPFEDNKFDFVYMTDVIHHVKDIDEMFSQIHRVLKDGGRVCIVTQSHRQIGLRYMSEFFPSTAAADKGRYPDIHRIVESAKRSGFEFIREETTGEGDKVELGGDYVELIEKKGYSMLHLISEEDYQEGLKKVKKEMEDGPIMRKSAGATLVWFKKDCYTGGGDYL